MRISIVHQPIQAVTADVLIVNLFEGVKAPAGATNAIDTALNGALRRAFDLGDFRGRLNETAVFYSEERIAALRVLVVGLGPIAEFTIDRARQASGTAMRRARDLGCKRVATIVHGAGSGGIDPQAAAQATIEGALLGAYQFREHKANPENGRQIDEIFIAEFDTAKLDAIRAGVDAGVIMADAINDARRLVNLAPNYLNPVTLADEFTAMAARVGLRCEVLDEQRIRAENMGAVLGVAQGSHVPPRFIVFEHAPAGHENDAPLVFIGKGVTFDTGGYSIKTADGMLTMKGDMAGAAAVSGAMQALAGLKLPMRVIGLTPLVENMIHGGAMRPGDVLTSRSGLTIEVVNTDAEGRLILADALDYARQFAPRAVVDIATLTSLASSAMGENMAACVLDNDDDLRSALLRASDAAGERIWPMPLWPDYADKIKSDVAELKNTGGARGGLGSSAIFLKRFVDGVPGAASYPWAHIDMAGMAFWSETRGYSPRGASGFGVRTLVQLTRIL
ncbi:MAG: leucyl aminopeptidase [Chloroflexi bacterium]|nr:leucyl aminopeptidase [Chloroflexota bacterium]